jgi:hypothetical protein
MEQLKIVQSTDAYMHQEVVNAFLWTLQSSGGRILSITNTVNRDPTFSVITVLIFLTTIVYDMPKKDTHD